MKFIIVLIFLAALASAEEDDRDTRYKRECVEQLKISVDKLEEFSKRKFTDDSQTHCFLKCMLQKYDLYDKDNTFNVSRISNLLSGDAYYDEFAVEISDTIEKCNKEANEIKVPDGCERAYRGVMCFMRESKYHHDKRSKE